MVVTATFWGLQVHAETQRLHLLRLDNDCIESRISASNHLRSTSSTPERPLTGNTTTAVMAEGSSKNGPVAGREDPQDNKVTSSTSFTSTPLPLSSSSSSASSRPRPKLGRASTVTWFNKSFDQASLRQDVKPGRHRQMRRQSSVSDFFHSVLSRSKSQIVGILSGKREKKEKRHENTSAGGKAMCSGSKCSPEPLRVSRTSLECKPASGDRTDEASTTFSSGSCPRNMDIFDASTTVSRPEEHGGGQRSMTMGGEKSQKLADPSPTSTFIVKKTLNRGSDTKKGDNLIVSKSSPAKLSLEVTIDDADIVVSTEERCLASQSSTEETAGSPRDIDNPVVHSKISLHLHPSIKRQSLCELKDLPGTASRSISSAPPGRSGCGHRTSNSLNVRDDCALFKRALVKSNSETLTTESVDQQPLAKASSDGNCFKTGPASSYGSQNSFISRITNYLFLGSVEAAYSEPLLCKYNISALIDMTNTSSTDVPLHKKTDCPCPCVDKNHFRSKLNIGIDDIEWENLEQYYEVINAFINGSRKKGGRILIFSYMGQSRAAAAAIQHLMCHYKIPFNEAYYIVKSRRPQIKVNSGFVKALRRLEKNLGLTLEERSSVRRKSREQGENRARGGDDEIDDLSKQLPSVGDERSELSFPYVVRGAWLEC